MARNRLTRLGVGIVVSAAIGLAGREALADPPGKGVLPVHVVAIKSDSSYDQADALTAAIRSRVRGIRGYSLGEGDFALEVLMLGLKCGDVADEPCQARIGNQIHADRFVWGTVEHAASNKQVVAELHLWVRGQSPSSTRLTYSDNLTAPGDESLRRLVDEALKKLLGASSSLVPERAGAVPPAKLPASPTTSTTAVIAPASATTTTSDVSTRRIVGWAGVGLGSFFLAAGLYSLVRVHDVASNDRYSLYLSGFHSNVNACDQARAKISVMTPGAATPTEMRDLCSELSTFETLEIVFFGAATIAAGTGIYLLATDANTHTASAPPAPPVQVGASAGPTGGNVELRVRF
jgi:hypothetical protein